MIGIGKTVHFFTLMLINFCYRRNSFFNYFSGIGHISKRFKANMIIGSVLQLWLNPILRFIVYIP